jgi:hypothetical protein
LKTGKYQELPCMYYGFVRKSVYEKIIQNQGRFFLSNQPDIYSTIALCMEDINFSYTNSHLCIAGISGQSNGGRMFTTSTIDEYKKQWKAEDDIGFLPGFENWKTINSLIIESALVYSKKYNINIGSILNLDDLLLSLKSEYKARSIETREELNQVFILLGYSINTKLSFLDNIYLKFYALCARFNSVFMFDYVNLNHMYVKNIDEAVLYIIDRGNKYNFFKSFCDNINGVIKMNRTR